MIRIGTWNVWWRFGDWRSRMDAIVQALDEARIDVCCFQEAWSTQGESQMQEVASRLGLDFSLFIDGGDSAHCQRRCEGQDGVSAGYGFVSRWPIARSELHRFDASRAMRQGRAIAMAQVDTPSGPLPVFTTHLSSA